MTEKYRKIVDEARERTDKASGGRYTRLRTLLKGELREEDIELLVHAANDIGALASALEELLETIERKDEALREAKRWTEYYADMLPEGYGAWPLWEKLDAALSPSAAAKPEEER